MAKFFGIVGFLKHVETEGSVWKEDVTERPYYGDVLSFNVRHSPTEKLNDDLALNNEISIVADSFAIDNCHIMKYVSYLGAKWAITSIKVERPRIILSVGGVYNAPEDDEGSETGT